MTRSESAICGEISTKPIRKQETEPKLKRKEKAPEAKPELKSKKQKLNRTKKDNIDQKKISKERWNPDKKQCQNEKNETPKQITTIQITTVCITWVPILIVRMMSWIKEQIKKKEAKSEMGKRSTKRN